MRPVSAAARARALSLSRSLARGALSEKKNPREIHNSPANDDGELAMRDELAVFFIEDWVGEQEQPFDALGNACIRQHTSAFVSIRQPYVSIRQHQAQPLDALGNASSISLVSATTRV